MFLPIVWRQLGWKKGWRFMVVFAVSCLLLFAPLFSMLNHIASSLDLYFRQFQFNASVYYLLRAAGFWIKGYDTGETLGPVLGLAVVLGISALAWLTAPVLPDRSGVNKMPAFLQLFRLPGAVPGAGLLIATMLQLSLSATVHPWYAALPFALGLVAGWRFPILWTGLIALSYSHYAGGRLQENYALIAIEYMVLWAFIVWEFRRKLGRSALLYSSPVSRRS
jgi:hypothetical protein